MLQLPKPFTVVLSVYVQGFTQINLFSTIMLEELQANGLQVSMALYLEIL